MLLSSQNFANEPCAAGPGDASEKEGYENLTKAGD
jgi:hypothetical protein